MKRILHILGPIEAESPLDVAGVVGHVCAVVRALWQNGISCDIAWTEAQGIEPMVLAELERFGSRSYLATLDQLPALAAQYPLIHAHVQGEGTHPDDATWYERLPAPRVITVHGSTESDDLPAVRVFAVSPKLCPHLKEAIAFPLAVDHLQWPQRQWDPSKDAETPRLLRAGSPHRVDRALFWGAVRRIMSERPIELVLENADEVDWAMIADLPESMQAQVQAVNSIDWSELISGQSDAIMLVVEREGLGVSSAQQFAMAASIPFVASAVSRLQDEDREGGVRCPASEEGIALAVDELCAKPALRLELGIRGRSELEDRLKEGVASTIEIYRRCGAGSTFAPKRSGRRYPRDLYAMLGLRAAARGPDTEAVPDPRDETGLLPPHEWHAEPSFETLNLLGAVVRMVRPDTIVVQSEGRADASLLGPLFVGEAVRLACTGQMILSDRVSETQKKLLNALGLDYAIGAKNADAADMVFWSDAQLPGGADRRGVNLTVAFDGYGLEGLRFGGLTFLQGKGSAERPSWTARPYVCAGDPKARVLHATSDGQFVLAADASANLLGEDVEGQVALIGQKAWLEAEPGTKPRLIVTKAGLCTLAGEYDLVHLYGAEDRRADGSQGPDQGSEPFDVRIPPPHVRTISQDEVIWYDTESTPTTVPSLQADEDMDALLGEGELVTFVMMPDRDRAHGPFWRIARKVLSAVPGVHLAVARADNLDAALRSELPAKLRKATFLLDNDVFNERAIADRASLCIFFDADEPWFQRAASRGIPCLLVGGSDKEAAKGYLTCDATPEALSESWQRMVEDPDQAAAFGQKARLAVQRRLETSRACMREAYLRRLGPSKPGFRPSGIARPRDLIGLLGLQVENGQSDLVGWSFAKPMQNALFTAKTLQVSLELCVFIHHLCAAEKCKRVLVLGPDSCLCAAYAAEACRPREGVVMVDQAAWVSTMRDLSLPVRAVTPGSVPDAVDLMIVAGELPGAIPQRLMFALSALAPQGILLVTHAFNNQEIRRYVKAQGMKPLILPSAQGLLLARAR